MEPPTPSLQFDEKEFFYREHGQPSYVSPTVQIATTPASIQSYSNQKVVLVTPQLINPQITQLGRNKIGVKIPVTKPGQALPLETNLETLNAIRKFRYKIERVNCGATFQTYNH